MNLMLVSPEEVDQHNNVMLSLGDRRAKHINTVLKLKLGDNLKVGVINGLLGRASLSEANSDYLRLELTLDQPAPPPLDITLILGLPRPKMMRRVIQTIATMGVKDLILINTYKVEKSYWQTPWLSENSLTEQLTLGIEQAVDTIMPTVRQFKLFKPFVEDVLPGIISNRPAWFAHPGEGESSCQIPEKLVLAIGPEGGFTPYEIGMLTKAGMQGIGLGERIMRVETVIPAVLGKLYL